MSKNEKLDLIQEILLTVLAILVVRLILIFAVDLNALADIICKRYENKQYNEYVYAKGSINEYVLDETSKIIMQGNIPKSLYQTFYENGGMVYVSDEELNKICHEEEKENATILGVFEYGETDYSIYLTDDLEYTTCGTLEHEFGHYLDYLFGWKSESERFLKIFEEEKKGFQENINNGEHYKTQGEYFAECYETYLTDKKKLKKYCPKTCQFIDELTTSLETYYGISSQ